MSTPSRSTKTRYLVRLGTSLAAATVLLGACGDRHHFPRGHGGSGGKPPDAGTAGSAGTGGSACSEAAPTTCVGTPPDYTTDIAPIVQQRCVGCHGPGGVQAALPLGSYADMQARGFNLIQARVRDCIMPPANSPTGALSSAQRQTLLSWLVCGAPNGSGSNDGGTTEPDSGPPLGSGIVPGPANDHCVLPDGGLLRQPIDPAACEDEDHDHGGGGEAYPDTNYGSAADDDDCKYHVSFSITPVKINQDVTFTVKLTDTVTGQPVVGANLNDAEIYIAGTSHIAFPSDVTTVEGPPGTYTWGPVRFDQSARWTLRFHLFDTFCDEPASPHGHLAFYIDVPPS